MKTSYYSKPSPQKREGEDASIENRADRIFGVLDGVTPIASITNPEAVFTDENGHNGAYLAANLFKAVLEASGSGTLPERIADANGKLRQNMLRYGIDVEIRHELWATCIAAVQFEPDGIRYAQLGDCMALARYTDGSVRVLTENRVIGLGARAKAKRERDRLNGAAVHEESFYQEAGNMMAYHRWMANTPEGYGVANGMVEVSAYIQTGLVDVERLTHLLLVTDGMFHPGISLQETMGLILEEGFERYVERVENAERERGMRPDDRTAVLIEV